MNYRAISAIARKDIKVVIQNKNLTTTLIVLILIIFGLLPWSMALGLKLLDVVGFSVDAINNMFARVAPALLDKLSGYNANQTAIVFILVYMLEPIFMLIPLMASLMIAADSFAGEKERKTLEALLYTPTTDRELFFAKVMSGWLAAVSMSLFSFVFYSIMVNAASWSYMHTIFFPNGTWLVLALWVSTGLPGLAIGLMVLISSRAQGFQDATQLGSLAMLPIIFLIMAQWSGVLYFNLGLLFLIGLVIWVFAVILIWLGSRSFHRDQIFTR